VRIWPHLRRLANRSGAEGRHAVREPAISARASSAPSASSAGIGFRISRINPLDPVATAWQKNPVARVPSKPPVGTA
jgi:hypothetical protein